MKKNFTLEYMQQNCGCYTIAKMESIFFQDERKQITVSDITNSSIPLKDKFWFVIKKTNLSTRQKQDIAIELAEIVLPLYENKYPGNKAPREAIEAAKQFLGGHISIERLIEKRRAAYAAAATATTAATTADDAYDAAAAAYAAAATATTAADAAADDDAYDAAATAATTADAADDDDAYDAAATAATTADAADDAYKHKLISFLNKFISSQPEE